MLYVYNLVNRHDFQCYLVINGGICFYMMKMGYIE